MPKPGESSRWAGLVAALLALMALPAAANADLITIDFDTTPALAAGPSSFPTNAEVVTVPGLATVSGGAVLSDVLYLAPYPVPGSSGRNVYGTAFFNGATYSPTITIDFDPSVVVTSVSGLLYNGETQTETFVVSAYSGSTLVDTYTLSDVLDSNDPDGYGTFSVSASSITRLVFSSASSTDYDYFIDDLAVTYQPVPEPSSVGLLGLGAAGLAMANRRRRR
jgi:hypothetical protein